MNMLTADLLIAMAAHRLSPQIHACSRPLLLPRQPGPGPGGKWEDSAEKIIYLGFNRPSCTANT